MTDFSDVKITQKDTYSGERRVGGEDVYYRWYGTEMPVEFDEIVDVVLADGSHIEGIPAKNVNWSERGRSNSVILWSKPNVEKIINARVTISFSNGQRITFSSSDGKILPESLSLYTENESSDAKTLFEINPEVGDIVLCYNIRHDGTTFRITKDWKEWGGAPYKWWIPSDK